jgi:CRP-like cAMP-binding protein
MPDKKEELRELLNSIFLFRKADEQQLDLLINLVHEVKYPQGTMIIRQGELASKFYILLNGEIQISQEHGEDVRKYGLLRRGDVFGFEMLDYQSTNLTSMEAVTAVTVLVLDRKDMRLLLEDLPNLNLDLHILYESYKQSQRAHLPWRENDEVVYYFSRRHWVNLSVRLLPVITLALVSIPIFIYLIIIQFRGEAAPFYFLFADILVILVWGILSYVDWSNDFSIITNRKVVFREKVILLYDSRQEAPLNALLSTTTATTWYERLYSFGDVIIRTYAGAIIFPKVPFPRQVATLVQVTAARLKSLRERTEREMIDGALRERIGLTPLEETQPVQRPMQAQLEPPDEAVGEKKTSHNFFSWLAERFSLRSVQGDVIVYHTHWFILLKRIFFPSLLFAALITLFLVQITGAFTFGPPSTVLGILILLGVITWIWWVYNYVDWWNDTYIITPDQVVDVNRKPLGREERQSAPIKNILSVEFKRLGVIGLLLNFGMVYIRVGESILTFDYVSNPAEVQRELFNRLAAVDMREKQAIRNATQEQVADWIEAYHRLMQSGDEKTKEVNTDEL